MLLGFDARRHYLWIPVRVLSSPLSCPPTISHRMALDSTDHVFRSGPIRSPPFLPQGYVICFVSTPRGILQDRVGFPLPPSPRGGLRISPRHPLSHPFRSDWTLLHRTFSPLIRTPGRFREARWERKDNSAIDASSTNQKPSFGARHPGSGSASFPNRKGSGSKGTVRPIKSMVKGRRKENVHTHVQSSTP